ncbi:MarR family transcriptional regulator [Candidatus Saccharibacteria bacterium]|nr:MAG: MarR family transcriptional regulator [Candidatus Saccharibacteria bacterium]
MISKNSLGYLLNHVAFVIARQSDQVLLERLGLGFSQYKIMMILQEKPHIRQKEIAEILGQTEASISRQIKLLTEQGLLQALRRPENKREHIITLTGKGERYTSEATDILKNFHSPIHEALNDKQKDALVQGLLIVHGEVCNDSRPGSCHHIFDNQ